MTRHPVLRLAAAALAAAALLLPAAAHAERGVLRDPAHDVARIDAEASDAAGTEVTVAARDERSTDITRVVVDHREDLLRVTVDVRAIGHHFYDAVDVRLRSQKRLWTIQVLRSGRETYTTLARGHRETQRACGGLLTTIDTRSDEVVVSVPTTCIESPRWVRVGVALFAIDVPSQSSFAQPDYFYDEAGVRGFEDDSVDVRGPKVHRG